MSKTRARGPESYAHEAQFHAAAVQTVAGAGFRNVSQRKVGAVKLVDATAQDGSRVSFWLKLGWSQVPYAAVQFGMFKGAGGAEKADSEFVEFVEERVARMEKRGVTHALLVHRDDFALALRVKDIAVVYREQMAKFPEKARNTKSPTMWIHDPRSNANGPVAEIVRARAIPLEVLAARGTATPADSESRSKMAEVELRLAQRAFRQRVGDRCNWKCVVTGCAIEEVLDSAHLPGKDWRVKNEAHDGILLRVDIHRLMDSGLAAIVGGRFVLDARLKTSKEYAQYDGAAIL